MRVCTALTFVFVAVLCVSAHGQELDIYDINDFVDPRELGARVASGGRLTCPCDQFLVSRMMAGGIANYLDIFRPTDAGASFVHVATSYYRGPWQANWKTTRLHREGFGSEANPVPGANSSQTPETKNTFQLARYFAVGSASSASIIRIEATWTSSQYRRLVARPGGAIDVGERSESEIGFEGDIPWRIGRFPLVTSLVYVGRFKSTDAENTPAHRRVTLLQRAPRISLGHWSLDSAVAVGSVNAAGKWHGATVQPSLHVVSPTIPGVKLRVNFRYTPALGGLRPPPRGQRRGSETENQFSVFIDRAIFVKRFSTGG